MYFYIVLAFVCMVWFALKQFKQSSYKHLPGPKGKLYFGNAPELDTENPIQKIDEWSKTYGDVFNINLAGTPVVVVSGSEAVHEILVRKGKDFSGRVSTYRLKLYTCNFHTAAFSDYTARCQEALKLVMLHIKPFGDNRTKLEDLTSKACLNFVENLKKANGTAINIKQKVCDLVTNLAYVLVHGESLTDKEERAIIQEVVVDHLWALVPGGSGEWLNIFPMLRFFGNKYYNALGSIDRQKEIVYQMWKQKYLGDENSFVSRMTKVLNGENKNGFNETHVKAQTWEMFNGGIATNYATLTCLFNILAQHPNHQKDLQHELDSVVGHGRPVSLQDRPKMPLHQATVLELIRYTSVVPLAIIHRTICDTSVAGFHIPKDTEIWPNLWSLNHDERVWDEPFKFNPKRFLTEDGELLDARHPSRVCVSSFGGGTRGCPGEVVSKAKSFQILATVIQVFDVLPATTPDEQPSCDPRDMNAGIVLTSLDYKVRFELREKAG